ncbi:metal-dependent transcriptional regulator [Archaeoglobus profundus]|uniref:Iron (Metal) dependent repressor, DtxR family n=1 Tax=Archaeoglobus profundus (strain DSM 5631 / JCM 9629 / NBRC 100127 / Av18) TaxID=572546 RepID=D2RFP9_ARCPA|nr:metal-dependent transcriptional regulator [Archaeoglobus profundus]ADB57124.1 iron (metal) dependent repressor, DtxR family [Archaeoglobus profundus DSM 5631]
MERVEEYLEAILDIQEKEKRVVRTSDIAKRLNVKPSSVTEMFIKLKDMGYVDYVPYRGVVLTEDGRRIAEKIKRYYKIFEKFFKFLGVDEEKAKELSCELEHHADEKVVERICTIISSVCDICDECKFEELPLSEAGKGKYVVLIAPKSAKDLIKVGDRIEVIENNDTIKIKVGEEIFELSKDFGKKIIVRKA